MNDGISTGFFTGGGCSIGSVTKGNNLGIPNFVPLFTPETPDNTQYSEPIHVQPGTSILIEAYNMASSVPIYVNKIVTATYNHNTASMCPPCCVPSVISPESQIVFRSRVTLGDGMDYWKLEADSGTENNTVAQLMIQIPGSYELELSDPDSLLGILYVHYYKWDSRLVQGLPFKYHAGIMRGNG